MQLQRFAAIVLVVASIRCGPEDVASGAPRDTAQRPSTPLRTEPVQQREVGESVFVTGTLAAYEQATAGAKVAGRVQQIAVDLGSPVRRGQLIARVDPADYALQREQAEAGVAQARARLGMPPDGGSDRVDPAQTPLVREARAVLDEASANRQRFASLLAEGLVSKADYEAALSTARVAESRYQNAIEEIRNRQGVLAQRRAEVAQARQQLSDTGIYAPFDGVVQQKQTSVGEYLSAGAPIVQIVKIDPLRFRAEIPERDATSVRAGQRVSISVDGAPREYIGRVTRLSPAITERSRVLMMEADIPNDGSLRAGSFARATIVTNASKTALTVPTDAIETFAGIQKVVVLENGKPKEKPVTTGKRIGTWTEIVGGLKPGERVVVKATGRR